MKEKTRCRQRPPSANGNLSRHTAPNPSMAMRSTDHGGVCGHLFSNTKDRTAQALDAAFGTRTE
jgi:hypothetical protein